MNHKDRTISGVTWSFIDSIVGQGLQFVFGLILARILEPRDFGIIGMAIIFLNISQVFVDSGFGNALIRKQNCSDEDYSTVFFYNSLVSLIVASFLFFSSGYISGFFGEPVLKSVLMFLSIGILLNGASVVQKVIFTKALDFKTLAFVSSISSFISGILAVVLAIKGFGVFSLVSLSLVKYFLNSVLLWVISKWKPIKKFSKESFFELFGFGFKLMFSALLNTAFEYFNYLVVGKFYSISQLGHYTRADQFKALPSQNLTEIINRVSYPILSELQNDENNFKIAFVRIIKTSMFFSFILMLGMAAISHNLIFLLIGEKWKFAVEYLQLLCFVGMLYPLHALNLNVIQVYGRSDIFLRLEIVKKIMIIPSLIIGVFISIKTMIMSLIIISFISFYLNAKWPGKKINYSWLMQLRDVAPSFFFALTISATLFFMDTFLNFDLLYQLLIQVVSGIILFFLMGELNLSKEYTYVKQILLERVRPNL